MYAAHVGIGIALISMKAMRPAAALDFDELCPGRVRVDGPAEYDEGGTIGNAHIELLHKGRKPPSAEAARLAELVAGYLERELQAGYNPDNMHWARRLRVHTQVMKDGELLVTSAEHKRASTRVSFFALVSFGPRGSLRVAKVESLLRVRELPGDFELGPDVHIVPSPPPAVCSVYARQDMQ